MKILVIGSGGREHAFVWKLSQDARVEKIYAAPGNGGTLKEVKTENVNIKAEDIPALFEFALKEKIDLTVVGPEVPLAMGITDKFNDAGLKVFGPSGKAAQMEASKAFAKGIMLAAGVPTASYQRFTEFSAAKEWIVEKGAPIVIKADGLAAGKGVTVAFSVDEALKAAREILVDKTFGETCLVAEEYLEGEEMSFLVITDGKTILPLATAQDHKAVYDNDKGPNTDRKSVV